MYFDKFLCYNYIKTLSEKGEYIMANTQKVKVYKYKNIAAALAVVLLVTVAISTSGGSSGKKNTVKNNSSSSSVSRSSKDDSDDKSDNGKVNRLTKNYRYEEMKNGTSLNQGGLVLVNSDHPYTGEVSETDSVYSYLFDDSGNQIMYATSTLIYGNTEMLESFNKLGIDFSQSTGLRSLMVSQLIPDDEGENKYDEAYAGVTVDLMLYDAASGTYPQFTGEGDYSWISQNCYKYGFVMRGTNRLRYVGAPFAEYIHVNNLDFEGFLEDVKQYSFESPLIFETEDEKQYAVYYVSADMSSTTSRVPVPLREDNTEYIWSVSGNNVDGYIVSVNLTDEKAPETVQQNVSDDTSSASEDDTQAEA